MSTATQAYCAVLDARRDAEQAGDFSGALLDHLRAVYEELFELRAFADRVECGV